MKRASIDTLTHAQLVAVEIMFDPRRLTDRQLDKVLDDVDDQGDELAVRERPDRYEPE